MAANAHGIDRPEEFVNVLAGTAGGQKGGQHHSTGNVLPLTAVPWGFNHWTPQTTNDLTSWFFNSDEDTFRGIRCTHQPSPWIGDYGQFIISPYFGYPKDNTLGFTSFKNSADLSPWGINLQIGPYGVQMELTPTNHGAVVRVSYPDFFPVERRLVCVSVPENKKNSLDEKRAKIDGKPTGECQANDGGIDLVSRRFSDGVPDAQHGIGFGLYARITADDNVQVSRETAQAPEDCTQPDVQWDPLNMLGQTRHQEESAQACQKRCQATKQCAHFTWWSDGGCHLQDASARSKKVDGVISGPPACITQKTISQCCFKLQHRTSTVIRVATSFISPEQARRNFEQEVSGKRFEEVHSDAKKVWNEHLSAIRVEDAGPLSAETFKRLQVFYTSLYRALLFPRFLDERARNGDTMHWSPYNGEVVKGTGVTDNGFWDTFRTVYPMLSLAYPNVLGRMLQGWLNAYKAGGWLPKWASPGYRSSMIGTFADVVLADAILKNISGFDVALAWEAMKKDAFEQSPGKDSSKGKVGLELYQNNGYISIDAKISEACSRTLDFAYADAACAKVADLLSKQAVGERVRRRSERALKEMFDARTGLMGHKRSSGTFKDDSPETWGNCYTEGSAWHHSFPAFNLDKLIELHGSKEKLKSKLHDLFTTPSNFLPGSYKNEIHEMREMRLLGLGQYAHNNQPVHHLPFLFALLGDRDVTAKLVRKILASAYNTEGFAGDEDNGEMGSWYVMSAIGLYDPTPGINEDYLLSSIPLFRRTRLQALNVTIEAPLAALRYPVVKGVRWRAESHKSAVIPYSVLRTGGTLVFDAESISTETADTLSDENIAKDVVNDSVKLVTEEFAQIEAVTHGTDHLRGFMQTRVGAQRGASDIREIPVTNPWIVLVGSGLVLFGICTLIFRRQTKRRRKGPSTRINDDAVKPD